MPVSFLFQYKYIMWILALAIALWKSGLFFVVFAISVNCDTQRISPLISFTLAFHIASELSLNTRSDKLNLSFMSSNFLLCTNLLRCAYIFFVRASTSLMLSSVLFTIQLQEALEDMQTCLFRSLQEPWALGISGISSHYSLDEIMSVLLYECAWEAGMQGDRLRDVLTAGRFRMIY